AQRGAQVHPGADADRARHPGRETEWAVLRRRRLPDQAVRGAGTGGAAARADPPRAPPGRLGSAEGGRPGAGPGQPARDSRRQRTAALADWFAPAHHPDARIAAGGQPAGDRARDLGQWPAGFGHPAQPPVQPAQGDRQAVRQAAAAYRAERRLPHRRHFQPARLIRPGTTPVQTPQRHIREIFLLQLAIVCLVVVLCGLVVQAMYEPAPMGWLSAVPVAVALAAVAGATWMGYRATRRVIAP